MTETFINASPTGDVRIEETDGAEYLVAPVTFIKSMDLHRGYVPKREVEKATDEWPGTPVIADHPRDEYGKLVSINNPTADKSPIGFIDNTETKVNGDAETRGEVWINVEKTESIGGEASEIKEELASNRTIGVSASYGGIRLPSGEYDGEERNRVVGNLRPDHVALLRDREGRCSITDGCMAGPNAVAANANVGLMLNAVSVSQDPDDPVSPETGLGEVTGDMTDSFNVRENARTPEYEGTESTSWSDVSKTLTAVTDALDIDADSVEELTSEQRETIAEHTLLGETDAEDWRDLYFFPVVNHDTGELNEGALEAVISGRGSNADIPDEAYENAASTATSLLESEFDRDLSSNAKTLIKRGLAMLSWNNDANDDPAEPGRHESSTVSETERTSELVDLGFNAENLPEEDTECFDRIYDEFAGNTDSEEPSDEDTEDPEEPDDDEQEPAVTFDSEEAFEETIEGIVDERVDEALAANQEAREKEELADEIIGNSDDYGDDDHETLMDSPVPVLEKLSDEVSDSDPSPDFGATRGVSANQETDGSEMPALSVTERMDGDD